METWSYIILQNVYGDYQEYRNIFDHPYVSSLTSSTGVTGHKEFRPNLGWFFKVHWVLLSLLMFISWTHSPWNMSNPPWMACFWHVGERAQFSHPILQHQAAQPPPNQNAQPTGLGGQDYEGRRHEIMRSIPFWKLTYPIPMRFWVDDVRFSQDGICMDGMDMLVSWMVSGTIFYHIPTSVPQSPDVTSHFLIPRHWKTNPTSSTITARRSPHITFAYAGDICLWEVPWKLHSRRASNRFMIQFPPKVL